MRTQKTNSIDCKTKYPILLVHGVGFRDDAKFNYWGRIPKFLTENGATIFFGEQDAWASVEHNAEMLQNQLIKISKETKYKKVNIIAHSKGGLDSRYMISSLGMQKYTASLTTISTPHHGLKTIDLACKLPKGIFKFIGFFVDLSFRLLGDKRASFANTVPQFSKEFMKTFNEENKDMPGVLYQSYAGKMKNVFSDLLFLLPFPILSLIDGKNDGLVTVESAKWGEFKGEIETTKLRGVSHSDEIDLWRKDFAGFDILRFYANILSELKKQEM